ncbi:YkgJ family cysteine cluster protein [Candidatus Methanocrinis natronophilus]|uniref:YkgJ family cysteine cluster protein n=1 Tax=Candidatus Methanocrinis natronophilus TaxID=3033396 RepID=A0ABT5X6Y4_9EURY|nr:YkgJ family cysteine cluster protein [Candidatus Methanocrinis natronophilus]MDF0590452.1 YkgJ family cysteine cluster protein [Candidatus Methanocrinis natronophilus]
MDRAIKAEILADLESQLERAESLATDDLARKIKEIGFRCEICGDCCRGEDNSVAVFPFEIRGIADETGESWLEVAGPPLDGEWDCEGSFHTLEWRLRKTGRDCRYFSDKGCKIYEARPLLCTTYPFYLEDCRLRWSECRGLGGEIGTGDSLILAELLKRRQIVEIREAVKLVKRYDDFERGEPSPYGRCIVHDSAGEHLIGWSEIPGALGRRLRLSRGR